jgi:hypothetical protein
MTGPVPIIIDQEKLQKHIEAQLGGLTVQCCIKDAIIEQLREEIAELKKGLLVRPDSGPNGVIHDKG